MTDRPSWMPSEEELWALDGKVQGLLLWKDSLPLYEALLRTAVRLAQIEVLERLMGNASMVNTEDGEVVFVREIVIAKEIDRLKAERGGDQK